MKHLPAHKVTGFKLTETKHNKPTENRSANKITLAHSQPDTSRMKMISDEMVFQPNSKTGRKYTITGNRMVFDINADTIIKSKNKFKIVLEDSVGNKKEYNSIDELPADARKEFLKENKQAIHVETWNNFQLQNDTSKLAFNNPAWKKQAETMRKQGELMRKQFNSPEWKAKTEKLRTQSEELRKQGEELRKQFDSPEWKAKTEKLRKQGEELRKQGEELRKQFNSPEWKAKTEKLRAQAEDMSKQYDNPEFKKQMEKLQEQSKAIEEQLNQQLNSPEFKKQLGNLKVQVGVNYKLKDGLLKYYQSPEWKIQEKNTQKLVDSARKYWRNSSDYQHVPGSKIIYIKPEELN